MKYYVVWKGRAPGIYATWDDCKKQTDGFPGALFKGFKNIEDAKIAYERGYQASDSSVIVTIIDEVDYIESVTDDDVPGWKDNTDYPDEAQAILKKIKDNSIGNHTRQTPDIASPLHIGKTVTGFNASPESPLDKKEQSKRDDGEVRATADDLNGVHPDRQGNDGMPLSSIPMKCQVCGVNDLEIYCTANTCEDCCKKGKCPWESKCINEHNVERRKKNDSHTEV